MQEQGHGNRERMDFIRKLNKSWRKIELSPLLKSDVKVRFVVLDLYE